MAEDRALSDGMFEVSSYTLNMVATQEEDKVPFPGNISPEGYFYSPFYKVTLKELDDELQYSDVRRINFNPDEASVETASTIFYNPDDGSSAETTVYVINIVSPVAYSLIENQPFCIYDILCGMTYWGYLSGMTGRGLHIMTKEKIEESGITGTDTSGKSRYIISYLSENAPEYAEFIPTAQRLVWRGPKKMSQLDSTSPLYNMPFTNGRLYIHKNVNVFVRRQDPQGDYKLYRPSQTNPLRRFQIEGGEKLDFDYVQEIIDSMVDAC